MEATQNASDMENTVVLHQTPSRGVASCSASDASRTLCNGHPKKFKCELGCLKTLFQGTKPRTWLGKPAAKWAVHVCCACTLVSVVGGLGG